MFENIFLGMLLFAFTSIVICGAIFIDLMIIDEIKKLIKRLK